MPIAPITGKLRKRLILDLTAALGLGTASGFAYWSVRSLFPAFSPNLLCPTGTASRSLQVTFLFSDARWRY